MDIKEIISSGVIELYVLGIATPAEIQLVEDCIAHHPDETLAEINAINEALAANASQYASLPPASMEEKIATRLFGEKEDKKVSTILDNEIIEKDKSAKLVQMPKPFKYVAAAAITLLIGSIIGNIILYSKVALTDKAIASTKLKLEEQIAINKNLDEQFGVLSNKYAKTVSLEGTTKYPDALARIYWMKNTGDVYVDATNLPTPPKGMQYQFWGIVDGKPVDGGLIFKNGTLKIEKLRTFGKAEAFAITLEKEGGVKEPTMPNMYVMAKT